MYTNICIVCTKQTCYLIKPHNQARLNLHTMCSAFDFSKNHSIPIQKYWHYQKSNRGQKLNNSAQKGYSVNRTFYLSNKLFRDTNKIFYSLMDYSTTSLLSTQIKTTQCSAKLCINRANTMHEIFLTKLKHF